VKPFDAVKSQVADDWKQDQRRRFQDKAATAMMLAVKGGKTFSDAATIAGVTPKLSPQVTRAQGNPDISPDLQRILFGLKLKDATMVQTEDGFVVAQLVEIVKPDPAADKTGYEQAHAALSKSISGDLTTVFVDALRLRAKPQINQQGFDSVVQPQ
jgi:peptidyl-prolyl cis-trans isomerase D